MLNILVSNQKEYSSIRLASGSVVLGRAPKTGGQTHTIVKYGIDQVEIVIHVGRRLTLQPRQQCQHVLQVVESLAFLWSVGLGCEALDLVGLAHCCPEDATLCRVYVPFGTVVVFQAASHP